MCNYTNAPAYPQLVRVRTIIPETLGKLHPSDQVLLKQRLETQTRRWLSLGMLFHLNER